MNLPLYILLLLGMLILLIGICVAYYWIYKKKINLALHGASTQSKPMPAPFSVAAVLIIAFLLFAILLSFIIGFGMGYRSLDRESDGQIDIQTLYAEITEIGTDTITVEGLQLNGTNYRSEFTFQLHEGLMIECNDTQISISDLNEGDFVSIILLTDLGGIEDVFKIYLISD